MRYQGFIMMKLRKKPIIVENLKEAIEKKEQTISLFDLFWRYSTPILLANYNYYDFMVRHTKYIPDTTTNEDMGWIGNVHLNHRPLIQKILKGDEKGVFMWQGGKKVETGAEERYIQTFMVFYDMLRNAATPTK